MTRNLSLLLLLYLLTSCSDADPIDLATVPVASNQVLQPWSEDINRWSWDGKTPELLLGASSYEAPFLEKEWKAELNYLKKTGGNYVRVNLPVSQNATGPIIHSTTGISPNQAYWSLLKEYLSFATEKGIAVEIQVWDFNLPARWDSSGWSSVIDFTEQPYLEGEHPFYRTIPGSIGHQEAFGEVKSIQEDFIDMLLSASLEFDNIIYNVQVPNNLLIPWMVHWAKYIEAAAKAQGKTANVNAGIVPDQRINIARFNQSILGGAAIAFHRPKPNGNGMNGLAQASIRGIRVVELHLKFHELKPAPELLLEDDTEATAATDGKGNYLIYLPSAGRVNLSPDWDDQLPVNVTVVGYLGTQRTEVLQPPYGDSFTLSTEEEKGGWMILKPQQQ